MIEDTVAKIEAAIREARLANKAELISLLEKLKAEVQSEKRSKDILDKTEESLKAAAGAFETEHPQLALVVGEVSAMLAKIGI